MLRLLEERVDLRGDLGDLPARQGSAEDAVGDGVGDGDDAALAHADDAHGDAGKHGFRELTPAVERVARGEEPVLLRADLGDHGVESLARRPMSPSERCVGTWT